MNFDDWLNNVLIPERHFDPTPKEISELRFAFEEGKAYGILEFKASCKPINSEALFMGNENINK